MKTIRRWNHFENARATFSIILLLITATLCCDAQTGPNRWTNSAGGKWEDTNSWSLHILPDASQGAVIGFGAGGGNVVIDSDTALYYGTSIGVSGLTLANPYTLVLSNTTESVSFHINGLQMPAGGRLDQYAGTSAITQFDMNDGACQLHNGTMSVDSLNLATQGPGGGSSFVQDGGTNQVVNLRLGESGSEYDLNDGALFSGDVSIVAALRYESVFQQASGIHVVTNTLTIQGSSGHDSAPAYYILTTGSLYPQFLQLNDTWGYSYFLQKGGTTLVSGAIEAVGPAEAPGTIGLDAGVLGCMTFTNLNGDVHIRQSGGTFIVTNLLQFGGYCPGANGPDDHVPAGFAEYRFGGGTLSASNIDLGGILDISNSVQSLRITNQGYFKLAGTINVGDANEQLGRFILAVEIATNIASGTPIVISNSVINFTGNDTTLAFAGSSSEIWSNAAMLFVTNWNGFALRGGNQLRFGTNASGLTASQLSQIRFVNPAGFPEGTYAARILSSGKVAPYAPGISLSSATHSLVVAWPDNTYALQFATNVLGPWTNIIGAISPYTNAFVLSQGFFRLAK